MAQKYKVFIDQQVLIITSIRNFFKNENNSENQLTMEVFLANHKPWALEKDLVLYSVEPKIDLNKLKKQFKFIQASGGLVAHEGKFLFIKRFGKWDLPKGKMDAGETPKVTALREIEEECNLQGHEIVRKICNTFHTYPLKEKHVLKKTYWFLLTVPNGMKLNLLPETTEGITEVRWFAPDEWSEIRQNTYASIIDVLDTYLDLKDV